MTELKCGFETAVVSAQGAWVEQWMHKGTPVLFPRQKVMAAGAKERERGGIHPCFPFYGDALGKYDFLPRHGSLYARAGAEKTCSDTLTEIAFQANFFGASRIPCDVTIGYDLSYGGLTERMKVVLADPLSAEAQISPAFRHCFATPTGVATIYADETEIVKGADFGPRYLKLSRRILKVGLGGVGVVEIIPGGEFLNSRDLFVAISRDNANYVYVEPLLVHPETYAAGKSTRLRHGKSIEISCIIKVQNELPLDTDWRERQHT